MSEIRVVATMPSTTVLLVESDSKDVLRIQQALTGSRGGQFQMAAVDCLGLALAYLREQRVDVVLMNFSLLDAHGLTVFEQIFQVADNALILILCTASEEEIGRQAVKLGAQDYFIKEHLDAHWFPRALGYHLERKVVQDALLASELRFRSMSDVFPFGIFVSDARGQCVYANAAYKEVSGINANQPQINSWSLELHGRMRTRFHREQIIQACELLLQERMPRASAMAHPRAEVVQASSQEGRFDVPTVRSFTVLDGGTPVTHLLSNGRYALMLTATGAGYSRWGDIAITRWREDVTLDNWGSFVFLHDVKSGKRWLPGLSASSQDAEHQEVVFGEDHAVFTHRDALLTSSMDVLVSGEHGSRVSRSHGCLMRPRS